MAETERFLLADIGNVDHVRDLAHFAKLIRLSPRLKHLFELKGNVEVIFNRVFAAAGHDRDVANA